MCTVGKIVDTLPEGPPVWGVTSLGEEVFLLRAKEERDQIEVYDLDYRLQRRLSVPNSRGFSDMTSCERYHCMYIADPIVMCIHRLDAQGTTTQWPVNDQPWGLSVNKSDCVLVLCPFVRKIKEFTSGGDLLRELTLPADVINPWHAIQLASGQFIVCHGSRDDPVHRVCLVGADGRQTVQTHGAQPGSHPDQCDLPGHLAVDDNEFVFVADSVNRRVTLLSPTLNYMRHVVSCDTLKWWPWRLHLDAQRGLLYVIENEWKNSVYTAGRVVVFSV